MICVLSTLQTWHFVSTEVYVALRLRSLEDIISNKWLNLFTFQRTIWVKQHWSFLLYIWLAENNRLLVHIQRIIYAQLWAKHERKESVCVVFSLGHSSLFGGNYILAELLKWLKFPLTWLFLGKKIEDQSLHAMHVQCAVSFLLFLLVFWWCVRCGLDIWQLCVSVFK